MRRHLPPEAGSAVATPIESGDTVTGTLTAYGAPGRPVPEETLGLLALALAGALYELELLEELAPLERDMERALASRATIDQAKGIVMADRALDAEAAWQHLVELSSTSNRKVRDIAAEIVDGAAGRGAATARRPPAR
ncbi:ANTAR domain-containing protein [Nocardioides pyridinolyticus]